MIAALDPQAVAETAQAVARGIVARQVKPQGDTVSKPTQQKPNPAAPAPNATSEPAVDLKPAPEDDAPDLAQALLQARAEAGDLALAEQIALQEAQAAEQRFQQARQAKLEALQRLANLQQADG